MSQIQTNLQHFGLLRIFFYDLPREKEGKKKYIPFFRSSSSSEILWNLGHPGVCFLEKVVRFSETDWQRSRGSSLLWTIDLVRQRAQHSCDSIFTHRSTTLSTVCSSFYITDRRFIINELEGTKVRPRGTFSSGRSSEEDSTGIAAATYRCSPFLGTVRRIPEHHRTASITRYLLPLSRHWFP